MMSYTSIHSSSVSKIYQDLGHCGLSDISGLSGVAESPKMEDFVKYRSLEGLKPPHVAVVGAGVSGLRCADILLRHGFQVTILEARDRIGGRMHQIQMPNTKHLVDVGPNWIHGTDHNPILDIAHETDTPTHSWGEKSNLVDEDGNLISRKLAIEINQIMWSIIVDAFKYSNEDGSSIPVEESLYDWFLERVNLALPETDEHYEEKRKLVLQASEMWGSFVGSPVQTQSLRYFWLEETIDGENLFCAGTYQKILARIAKPAIDDDIIKYSTKVTQVHSIPTDGRVAITTNDGQVHLYDEVVMTTPLGWLKRNQDAFGPPLPKRFADAIDAIGYGCLEKVYITFPRAFWINSVPSDLASESFEDAENTTGFISFLSPNYSPLNPVRWNQEAVELASLPDQCAHPTLLFYIYGDQSRSFSALLGSIPESAHHSHLVSFFQAYYSRLPNYSASSPDCIPISTFATNWLADDYAGNGSYSNFQIGLESGDRDIEIMREGLPGRGVWFAGEHTSTFLALGTVTGAYWSGETVAKRISKAYGIEPDGRFATDEVDLSTQEKELNIRGVTDLHLDM